MTTIQEGWGDTPTIQEGWGNDTAPAPPTEPPSVLGSLVRKAGQGFTFGLSDEIAGLLGSGSVSGPEYEKTRDAYRAKLAADAATNPIASKIGEVGGAVASSLIPGVGEVGGLVGGGVKGAALTGAALGGLSGLGYSEGRTAGDVAKDTAAGAGTGAVLGGATHAILSKVGDLLGLDPETGQAINRQNESIAKGASERALPRKQSYLASLIGDEGADTDVITPGKAIQENKDVLKDLRSADPEKVQQAIQDTGARSWAMEIPKAPYYDKVNEALGGGFEAKVPIEELKTRAAYQVPGSADQKVLLHQANTLTTQLSTLDTTAAKVALERVSNSERNPEVGAFAASLPDGQKWTQEDFLDHATGLNGKAKLSERAAATDPVVRDAIQSLPYKYDPNAKIPTQFLRKALSDAQDDAATAMGTVNATKNAKLARLGQDAHDAAMDRVLGVAEKSGAPGIADTVSKIRDINARQSTLLALTNAAKDKLVKLKLGRPTLGGVATGSVTHGLGAYELVGAGKDLLGGNVGGAAKDVAAAAALRYGPQLYGATRLGSIDLTAAAQKNLRAAYQAGSPWATNFVKAARRTPAGAAKVAAILGSEGVTE